jgi:hypothetical protein
VSGPSWPSPGGSLGSGGGALQRWVRQHRWAEWENDPGEVPKVRSSRPYRRVKPGVDTIPSTEAPRRVVTGAYFGRERVGLGLVGGGDSLLCLSTGRAHDLPAACRLEMLTECPRRKNRRRSITRQKITSFGSEKLGK